LVALIVTVVGLVSGLIAVYEFAERRRQRHTLRWHEVCKLLVEVIGAVERDRFTPDLILGVGRGGAIVAAMFATNTPGRIPFAVIDTEFAHIDGRKVVTIRHGEILPDVTGRNVLVVVAELYSGQDMVSATEFVRDHNPASLKTLALLAGPTTVMRPDFCGRHTKHEPMAPWRITEAGRNGRI
jgi:hypoxanthine phosphoribosyltransferase